MRTTIRVLAVGLTLVAVVVGAIAVFASGYTAGNYVHDLVLVVFALAVLSLTLHGTLTVRNNGKDHDDD